MYTDGVAVLCVQVVLQRDLLRGKEDQQEQEEQTEIYFLQISQIVALVVLIFAV
jgi:hypothetical protein